MQAVGVRVETSHDSVLDIVGTGGDGANTVNISTGACILAAACGARVAKVCPTASAASSAAAVYSPVAVPRRLHSGSAAHFAGFKCAKSQSGPNFPLIGLTTSSSVLVVCVFSPPLAAWEPFGLQCLWECRCSRSPGSRHSTLGPEVREHSGYTSCRWLVNLRGRTEAWQCCTLCYMLHAVKVQIVQYRWYSTVPSLPWLMLLTLRVWRGAWTRLAWGSCLHPGTTPP